MATDGNFKPTAHGKTVQCGNHGLFHSIHVELNLSTVFGILDGCFGITQHFGKFTDVCTCRKCLGSVPGNDKSLDVRVVFIGLNDVQYLSCDIVVQGVHGLRPSQGNHPYIVDFIGEHMAIKLLIGCE